MIIAMGIVAMLGWQHGKKHRNRRKENQEGGN